MTVRELITKLLNCDMNGEVMIEYPNTDKPEDGNYCRYLQAEKFMVSEYFYGVVIGIPNEN